MKARSQTLSVWLDLLVVIFVASLSIKGPKLSRMEFEVLWATASYFSDQ